MNQASRILFKDDVHADNAPSNAAKADALTLLLRNNQHALGAAIEEITRWIAENGSDTVVDNAVAVLETLDRYAQAITDAIMRLRNS